ncbi:MAG: dihydroxyacetone kinase subunit L [Chloroflexi bacterium]|nr:MAG: dihydroxyacetone kinase subunit L [Chloroflexota bacterium]
MVSRDDVLAWIDELQKVYAANRQYLTDLDSAIGDADHGINMDRGFTTAKAELEKTPPADINAALKTVAMALIRTVGGAAGPLYGTFFMRAAAACANKQELDAADVVALFEAGLAGVIQRGKAELNDKTMVDALSPALEAMKQALQNGHGIKEMLQSATEAAETGMKNTIPLKARKGRASYLGDRSIGHQDPGATSSYLMIKTAADLWS